MQSVFQVRQGRGQSQLVTLGAETAYNALGDIGKIGFVAKRFTAVDIGQMHFDKWNSCCQQGIAKRNAGVREGRGIENNEVDTFLSEEFKS